MNRTVSIYSLLKYFNLIVFVLMILCFQNEGPNQYVNQWTVVIGAIMALTTHLFLWDASKNNNALLGVFAFVMLLYFELRIVTLNYTDSSLWIELRRPSLPPTGINVPLLYVLLGYILSGLALRIKSKRKPEICAERDLYKRNASRNIIMFLFVSLLLSAAPALGVPGAAQICGILSTFFLNMLFMMLYAFVFFIKAEHINKKEYYLFFLFLLLFVGIYTVIGSRSTLMKIVTTALFALLALDKIRIKRKYVLIVLIIAPFSVYLYVLSTISRALGGGTMTFTEQQEIVEKASERFSGEDLKTIITPVVDRLGYLDYATEIYYNRPHLSQYITIPTYFKSVVDNLLTPGFDIFDVPKVSTIIPKTYELHRLPTRNEIDDSYQSDALTIYGEIYLLFGPYFAFFVFFILFRIICIFYRKHQNSNSIRDVWIRAVVLYELNALINSMGLDWIIIDLVAFVINYYIFCKITLVKDTKKVGVKYSYI